MSVIIKVSYTDDQELTGVIKLLSPVIKSYKVQPAKGQYKRAYITLKPERTKTEQRPEGVNICDTRT